MGAAENNLPEDDEELLDDWAQGILIVTQSGSNNDLCISEEELWGQFEHGIRPELNEARRDVCPTRVCSLMFV